MAMAILQTVWVTTLIMGLIVDTHISLFYKGSTKRFCGLYRFKAPFGGDEESALSGTLLNMVGA